ncbi:MAG: hypothetical protein AAF485_07495, partial [Chloroflexota bacterium]
MNFRVPKLAILLSFLTLIGAVLLQPEPALAHTRVEIGPYVIIVGWVEEPVIVGERNALLLEVTEGEEPIIGLESSLELEVLYAGRTFIGNVSPSGVP